MFNLGIKQIVINSSSVVTETAGVNPGKGKTAPAASIKIDGFGTFSTSPTGADDGGFVTPAVAPALGAYTVTFGAGKVVEGDVIDVRVYTDGARILGELWPYNYNSFIFQAVVAKDDKIGSALVAGQNGLDIQQKVVQFSAGANELAPVLKVLAGYEGVAVKKVTYTKAGESYSNDADSMEIPLTLVQTTAPSEGLNTGRMIEAEVRNAIFENIDPYGVSFGGNSAVDVRGMYTEIHWATLLDGNGWEPHEMLGRADVNTTATYAARHYSAFVNEASAAAAITILKKLAVNIDDIVGP